MKTSKSSGRFMWCWINASKLNTNFFNLNLSQSENHSSQSRSLENIRSQSCNFFTTPQPWFGAWPPESDGVDWTLSYRLQELELISSVCNDTGTYGKCPQKTIWFDDLNILFTQQCQSIWRKILSMGTTNIHRGVKFPTVLRSKIALWKKSWNTAKSSNTLPYNLCKHFDIAYATGCVKSKTVDIFCASSQLMLAPSVC